MKRKKEKRKKHKKGKREKTKEGNRVRGLTEKFDKDLTHWKIEITQ